MARVSKKLKIGCRCNSSSNNDNIHFDEVDNTLAEEHRGYYLMTTVTRGQKNTNPRVYLSHKHKVEYFKRKFEETRISTYKTARKSLTTVFDYYEGYEKFLNSAIKEIFPIVKRNR
ncbi:hypothetical protein, partial [Poseidonibacter ostreae]